MKAEITGEGVNLIPENRFDEEALKKIKEYGVSNVQFENSWEGTGKLILKRTASPFDRH